MQGEDWESEGTALSNLGKNQDKVLYKMKTVPNCKGLLWYFSAYIHNVGSVNGGANKLQPHFETPTVQ